MFKGEAYRDGRDFMERNDGPEHRLLFHMRLAAGVFAVGLSVMVFLMGSELFGESSGLLALLLVVFEPNVLANSALVTTDMGVACFFLATIYCFYRYARQPSVIRLLLTGLAAGLRTVIEAQRDFAGSNAAGTDAGRDRLCRAGTEQADGWDAAWRNGSHRDRCGRGALGFLRLSLCGPTSWAGHEPDLEQIRCPPHGDQQLGDRACRQLAIAARVLPDGHD